MSAPYVWVELYYQGKDEPVGDAFQVYRSDMKPDRQMNIGALKEAVKDKRQVDLSHCDAAKLVVYPPKSSGNQMKYAPDKEMKEVIAELEKKKTPPTSGEHPLIVVAPKKQLSVTGIEDIKQLAAFARKEMASKVKSRDMSKASTQFAQDLVAGLGILVKLEDVNKEPGDIAEPPAYAWTRETTDGDTLKIGEHQGTPGARNWFRTNFLSGDLEKQGYVCQVVTGHCLPKLTAGGLSASGKGDMVIGDETSMQYADSVYEQAAGLIELKTDEYPIKVGQMILELTAFSMISRFGRGAVLLASDCNTKWRLVWFQDYKTICRRNYVSGRKCWMDFREMIRKAEARSFALVPPTKKRLTVVKEDETEEIDDKDLGGFDHFEDDAKQKAVENEAMLHQLSNFLGSLYGERPVVPAWAQAKNVCPDYYM